MLGTCASCAAYRGSRFGLGRVDAQRLQTDRDGGMREAGRLGAKTLSGEWTKGFSNIRHCYDMRRAMRNPLLGAHDARLGTGWKLGGMSSSLDETVLHSKPVAGREVCTRQNGNGNGNGNVMARARTYSALDTGSGTVFCMYLCLRQQFSIHQEQRLMVVGWQYNTVALPSGFAFGAVRLLPK